MIDGHSIAAQPIMWRNHFKEAYRAAETPYEGNMLKDIEVKILNNDILNFDHFKISEINNIINEINTSKSYERHNHWKFLQFANHPAKLCLNEVFKFWILNVLRKNNYFDWDFFLTNVSFIPKRDKKDLSIKKSWRPISIGTSENWILEKLLLLRLNPYLKTKDCQFGYKPEHSSSHAIEIIRIMERSHDAHICLLDASSAFDKLSWRRIKNQLLKRKIPLCLIKIVMIQLFSSKINVCNTAIIFPRDGVKQGGVLSGILFSSCYDDLANALSNTGAGVLLNSANHTFQLICVLIYADDIVLVASSPCGLKTLIEQTFLFASTFNDITFNPSKSWILRLGPHRKPVVSVCEIPTSECR